MSVYTYVAIPMICVALLMFYLAHKNKEKNFIIMGITLLFAGFVNLILGLAVG